MGAQGMVLYPTARFVINTLVGTSVEEWQVRELVRVANEAAPWTSRYPQPHGRWDTPRPISEEAFIGKLTIDQLGIVTVEWHHTYAILTSSAWAYDQYVRKQEELLKTFPDVVSVTHVMSWTDFRVYH